MVSLVPREVSLHSKCIFTLLIRHIAPMAVNYQTMLMLSSGLLVPRKVFTTSRVYIHLTYSPYCTHGGQISAVSYIVMPSMTVYQYAT